MARFDALEALDDLTSGKARAALREATRHLSERGLSAASHCIPRSSVPVASTPRSKEGGTFPTHSTPALNVRSPAWSEHQSTSRTVSDGAAWPWRPSPADLASPSSGVRSPVPPHTAHHVRFDQTKLSSPLAPRTYTFADQTTIPYEEAETYAFAKSCFDQRQYDQCAWLLEREAVLSEKARFLQLYARFLIFERDQDEQELLPPLAYAKNAQGTGAPAPNTPSLVPLLAPLVHTEDPFLLFLKGVLLRRLHKRVEAMDCLLTSVRAFAYNWSAWQELGRTLDNTNAELEQIMDLLPNSFMSVFFIEYASRQATQADAANLARIDALLHHFPGSTYLITSKAQSLYLQQQLEEAADTFQQALQLDPFRMDGISEYSNTLYVLDHAGALAQLVQQFAKIGKDRPEVCCLIGNYYNQRSDHFRAIESFKRALRLDRDYVAAWILLGHEYLELKNSHAAAEMYRRALEINPQDYRPWHGLGQVYELNEAWSYAIHYYQKCAAIRPYDARMWASLGVCYDRLGRNGDAIACFKRHLTCPLTQMESVDAISRIIDLYERQGDTLNTTMFHRLLVQVVDRAMDRVDAGLVARFAVSYVIAAQFEMGELQGKLFRAKERADESSTRVEQGDVKRAYEYLQKVVLAGTDMSPMAEELLNKLSARGDSR
ncbi:Cdc23p [Malassezia vespertilionis]|uniref:Cdc23p n=1 Tax=Malassezia vespertilionis TaxID=2020962 RepID=A0A2N1J8F2_9BASI|nr:Cdc23p [Malassezia vespertilionis]